jgi:hypothetical protein
MMVTTIGCCRVLALTVALHSGNILIDNLREGVESNLSISLVEDAFYQNTEHFRTLWYQT